MPEPNIAELRGRRDALADRGWPPLQELPGPLPPPPLTREMMPEPLADWCWDEAERATAPAEFAAVPLLISLGAVHGRRVALAPKASDEWHEFGNLWGGIVAPPGSMKTPIMNAALRFVRQLEWEAERIWYEGQRPAIEEQVVRWTASAAQGEAGLRRGKGTPSEVADAKRNLREAEQELKAGPPRIATSDATVEKLQELLARNPRGLLLTRDELAGWLRQLDRENRSGERESWLELWSGKEPLRVDRIGRGSLAIPPSCVSIVGGIQPGKLRRYVEEAAAGRAGADGLLQRFSLLVWPEVPEYRFVDRAPDASAAVRLERIFRALDDAEGAFGGLGGPAVRGRAKKVPVLRFGPEAQELASAWLEENGKRAREEGRKEVEILGAWLSKRPKTFAALSLIFHAVEAVDRREEPGHAVGLESARRAAAWCELLEAHARKIYGESSDPERAGAAALAVKIRLGAVCDGDSVRSIYRNAWTRLRTPEDVRGAVGILERLGWCRVEKRETGGRPSGVLRVNPAVDTW